MRIHTHAPPGYPCPFCLLVQGVEDEQVYSVQSDIVYRDDRVISFVSSHQWPRNHGNVIIAPTEHFENLYDLPASYGGDIQRVAQMVALAMKKVYGCDGISTRQHNEPAGDQDVWHYHLHVTPRYTGDRFYATHRELMAVEERAKHATKLRRQLDRRRP